MKPYWTFGESRRNAVSLDEFLAQKEAAGVEFFHGKEPWLDGLHKVLGKPFFGSALKRWTTSRKGPSNSL
jgi:hypothetical protein